MQRGSLILAVGLVAGAAALSACSGSNNKSTNVKPATQQATVAVPQTQVSQATAAPPTPPPPAATKAATAASAAATKAAATTKPATAAGAPSAAAGGVSGVAKATLPAAGAPFTVPTAFSFVDSIGAFHVVGEVKNNGNQSAGFVQISGTFYDAANKIVGSESAYTELDVVPAGQVSPFDVFVLDAAKLNIAVYKLQVKGEPATDQPVTGLKIQGDSGQTDNDSYVVLGEVLNGSGAGVKYVKVIAELFNAAGTLVSVEDSSAELDTIAAGESSSFKIISFEGSKLGVKSYRLFVQGDRS